MRRVEQCLDRLTTILRHCEPRALLRAGVGSSSASSVREAAAALAGGPSPVVESVQRLFPVLEAVYQTYKAKADVMEKVRWEGEGGGRRELVFFLRGGFVGVCWKGWGED